MTKLYRKNSQIGGEFTKDTIPDGSDGTIVLNPGELKDLQILEVLGFDEETHAPILQKVTYEALYNLYNSLGNSFSSNIAVPYSGVPFEIPDGETASVSVGDEVEVGDSLTESVVATVAGKVSLVSSKVIFVGGSSVGFETSVWDSDGDDNFEIKYYNNNGLFNTETVAKSDYIQSLMGSITITEDTFFENFRKGDTFTFEKQGVILTSFYDVNIESETAVVPKLDPIAVTDSTNPVTATGDLAVYNAEHDAYEKTEHLQIPEITTDNLEVKQVAQFDSVVKDSDETAGSADAVLSNSTDLATGSTRVKWKKGNNRQIARERVVGQRLGSDVVSLEFESPVDQTSSSIAMDLDDTPNDALVTKNTVVSYNGTVTREDPDDPTERITEYPITETGDNTVVHGDATVEKDLHVQGDFEVDGLVVAHDITAAGALHASEAVIQNDVAIHGDLYVAGTTTTTNEAEVETSGSYIVTRNNATSVLTGNERSGLVVNNYATDKSAAITVANDGTFRVSADTTASETNYSDISSFDGNYYEGLTGTSATGVTIDIPTNVVAGELTNVVLYNNAFYHYTGADWKGPLTWSNGILDGPVVTDIVSDLEALTKHPFVYYESITSKSINIGSEQPLMTRNEAANMANKHVLVWDGCNSTSCTTNLQENYNGNNFTEYSTDCPIRVGQCSADSMSCTFTKISPTNVCAYFTHYGPSMDYASIELKTQTGSTGTEDCSILAMCANCASCVKLCGKQVHLCANGKTYDFSSCVNIGTTGRGFIPEQVAIDRNTFGYSQDQCVPWQCFFRTAIFEKCLSRGTWTGSISNANNFYITGLCLGTVCMFNNSPTTPLVIEEEQLSPRTIGVWNYYSWKVTFNGKSQHVMLSTGSCGSNPDCWSWSQCLDKATAEVSICNTTTLAPVLVTGNSDVCRNCCVYLGSPYCGMVAIVTQPDSSQICAAYGAAIGFGTRSTGFGSVAFGDIARAHGCRNVAIGCGAGVLPVYCHCTCCSNNTCPYDSIAIGTQACSFKHCGIAIGYGAKVGGNLPVNCGPDYCGNYGIAIGATAMVCQTYGIAIGKGIVVNGNYGIAIGTDAYTCTAGVSIGLVACACAQHSIALGACAKTFCLTGSNYCLNFVKVERYSGGLSFVLNICLGAGINYNNAILGCAFSCLLYKTALAHYAIAGYGKYFRAQCTVNANSNFSPNAWDAKWLFQRPACNSSTPIVCCYCQYIQDSWHWLNCNGNCCNWDFSGTIVGNLYLATHMTLGQNY